MYRLILRRSFVPQISQGRTLGVRTMASNNSDGDSTDPTLSNATSAREPPFSKRGKAKENQFIHELELDQLKKLKEQLKSHRENLNKLETEIDSKLTKQDN
ncbi:mitochondrial proton-transporting ATP synthase inhibitor Inh1 [Schizosaccharomyces osmophilus]|uniref:ATPase inhibitor, mitochondrial n=1 Tax=Schizosaccharomyces osmophilus TaxID=2545709 RepID=A0AAE9WJA6_9SCHI|nr:mitochondrial proton-transporting ATP synthase inhibitor Inh1 [Schizosaccharomyces osmophilus]WBW75411.1 mitochondrial proton-transporting ATP synthase inhibitor Inh1 [Schizosaccharomyces osmophilus]